MTARTRVLVVDDSAFARKVVREVLAREPDLEIVGIAHDGLDALEKIDALRPDVITLDLVMPGLDGAGVLEALAKRDLLTRAVIVTTADEESPLGVAALTAGAFDLVHKPTSLATDRLYELGAELVAKVRAAATAPKGVRAADRAPRPVVVGPRSAVVDIVVIGASTGGPPAIAHLLAALPGDLPVPIAIVLHMPPGYTAPFAARLDHDSKLDVIEARDGLELGPGRVVIGRAGMHLVLERRGKAPVARLSASPAASLHRPSVDVLFSSAAAWGARALGVVLTGMGNDGVEGARAMRTAGGRLVVEAESSCVVYGMPRAVAEAGLADAQIDLADMARAIVEQSTRP